MFDGEESKLIKEDQKRHPNCNYSQSYRMMCSNRSGEHKCENIKKIIRSCPNQRPVEIYNHSDGNDPNNNTNGPEMDFGTVFPGSIVEDFFGRGNGEGRGIESLFNDFFQHSQRFGNQLDQFRDLPQHKEAPHLMPPHRLPKGSAPNFKIDGYVSGPPESI